LLIWLYFCLFYRLYYTKYGRLCGQKGGTCRILWLGLRWQKP